MTTRSDATVQNPDQNFEVGFHSVYVDNYSLFSFLTNHFLTIINSRKRVRLIIHEDAIRASGILTPEVAGDIANRLVIGPDGNFFDPQQKKGLLRILQYLGFTK